MRKKGISFSRLVLLTMLFLVVALTGCGGGGGGGGNNSGGDPSSTANIGITVNNTKGQNIAAVRFSVDNKIIAVTVDANGKYTIPGVTAGSHKISAVAVGYYKAYKTISVVKGSGVDPVVFTLASSETDESTITYQDSDKCTITGSISF